MMNKMQQPSPQTFNAPPPTPLNLVSTDQIQKYLDENKNLIMAILECQKTGKVAECAQYQTILQKNLMYLAAIADAQPPGSTTPSQLQMSTSSAGGAQGDSQIQASAVQNQQQQQLGGTVAKLPFQLNALRPQPQDQQNQLMQFQQQQMQGHFNVGANNGLHMLMQPGHGNMMDIRGNVGPGNPGLGRDGRA